MQVNPYESPRPVGEAASDNGPLQDRPWSLTLTGLFAGGYVGAWVGSLSGAGVGVLFALVAGNNMIGYRNPAFGFVESLITTGLLIAILGTLMGAALGSLLGVLLGSLVAVSNGGLRKQFTWVSCVATCLAAMGLAATIFRVDLSAQEWRPLAADQLELFSQVAAISVVGLGGFFGGGLLGRILREVAWERGAWVEVVADDAKPRME
jgi:hypothetical protein